MSRISLRRATEADGPAIRGLVRRVRINPVGLEWNRFLLAVDESGRVLGCGQLKPHGESIVELASIAVEPVARGKGIARAIIDRLIAAAPRPLYLTCRANLGPFYEKWGFRSLEDAQMPAYFRRLSRLASVLSGILRDEGMLVMMLQ